MKKATVLLGAVAIGLVLIAVTGPSWAQDMATAKQNYETFCSKCHGPTGKGDGPASGGLSKRPAAFTDCALMSKASDDKLFNIIKNGGAANGLSGEMAPWKEAFDDKDIRGLVAYVRTFCKK